MKKTKAQNILDNLIKNFNDPVEFFKVLRGIQSEGFMFSIDLLVKLYNEHKEGKKTFMKNSGNLAFSRLLTSSFVSLKIL